MQQQRTYGEMVDAGEPMSAVFMRVVDLHRAVRATPVKNRMWTYAWTHDGQDFRVRMNGLKTAVDGIQPLHLLVEMNGWPAVLTDMFDGTAMGAHVEAAVLRAIDAEITRATEEHAHAK